jgi:hypothetical protein
MRLMTIVFPIRLVMCIVGLSFLLSLSSAVSAQSALSPEVQKDLVRNKIMAAAERKDYKTTLQAIDQYRELKGDFPPPLLLVEAKSARQVGDALRAIGALTAFMNTADHHSAQYKNALALYPIYQHAAEPALERQKEEQKQAEVEAQRLAQAREKEHQKRSAADAITTARRVSEKAAECREIGRQWEAFNLCTVQHNGILQSKDPREKCVELHPEWPAEFSQSEHGAANVHQECRVELASECRRLRGDLGAESDLPNDCNSVHSLLGR